MWTIAKEIFGSNSYMPYGDCYLWQMPLIWLYGVSDALVAIACFSIFAMGIYWVGRRRDIAFKRVFIFFGACFALGGTGYLLDAWNLWVPSYWLSGGERAVTAIAFCGAAAEMAVLLPRFFSLKAPELPAEANQQLEVEIAERKRVEAALQATVEGTAAVTGNEFFAALAHYLADGFEVRYVSIAETTGELEDRLRTIAFWDNNSGLGENCEYAIAGTPLRNSDGCLGYLLLFQLRPG